MPSRTCVREAEEGNETLQVEREVLKATRRAVSHRRGHQLGEEHLYITTDQLDEALARQDWRLRGKKSVSY